MSRSNIYIQAEHSILLDGVPVIGFADGDYMSFKADGNAATRTQGGDGPSMNISTAQGGVITLGLLPTSPILGKFYELREAQKSLPRLFSFQALTGTREIIQAEGCGFGDLSQFQSGGPEMRPREFTLEALRIIFDTSGVEQILGAVVGA